MQFKENANVYTVDDNKVGEVERVVLDPQTKEITHLVVRKGFLLTEDKVVPIDLVDQGTEDRVILKKIGDLESLPDFEESQYVQATPLYSRSPYKGGYARPYIWYPSPGLTWWAGITPYPLYPVPGFVKETWQNIPEGAVGLKEGADVIAADDEKVGNVERVFANPQQERATHLLISKGLLLKKKKLIPTTWITRVSEDAVHLVVHSDFLDRLPEYEGAPL
ncbi:MAG: PRC-barrel domain-containing protein [Anaerolineae bacterium]|nr:PRC-barrel domain-containing protein [Anaerolineae bacterium]